MNSDDILREEIVEIALFVDMAKAEGIDLTYVDAAKILQQIFANRYFERMSAALDAIAHCSIDDNHHVSINRRNFLRDTLFISPE